MGETLNDTYQAEHFTLDKVSYYWPMVERELEHVRHIWERWYTKEYLYNAILSGDISLWGVGPVSQIRLIVFTRIVQYPSSRVLTIFLAVGNGLKECLPSLIATLERYAQIAECTHCDVIGRPGWERLLSGFKREATIYTRVLNFQKVQ